MTAMDRQASTHTINNTIKNRSPNLPVVTSDRLKDQYAGNAKLGRSHGDDYHCTYIIQMEDKNSPNDFGIKTSQVLRVKCGDERGADRGLLLLYSVTELSLDIYLVKREILTFVGIGASWPTMCICSTGRLE
jgi:hypothetical protein